jgi:hypothetical protein
MFAFGESTFRERNGEVTVTVEFEAADGTRVEHSQDILGLRMNADADGALTREAVTPRAPFPYRVVSALRQLRPDVYAESGRWSDDLVGRAVDDLLSMVSQRAPVKPVLAYVLYLKAMATVFEFIGDHFDRINHLTEPEGKDIRAIASSPAEMLCIANHLYVLQSHGLEGGFVECGCFKGFSTCCLSQACDAVGLQLDVFDSFAGLPKSASSYYQEGEFRGSIDEVRDNLRAFGRSRSVELHQGFFADTIPPHQGQVMGIWMDVDLQSSSRDVMEMLPRLPITSCVFTHECPPDAFENG